MKIRAKYLLFSRRSWLWITNKVISKISFDQPIWVVENLCDFVIFLMNLLDRYFFFLKVMFYINVFKRITIHFIK